jgi:hypothetical protein
VVRQLKAFPKGKAVKEDLNAITRIGLVQTIG